MRYTFFVMSAKIIFLSLLILGSTIGLRAQDTKDPIDKALSTCLDSPSGASTVGQIDCAGKAFSAWDSELNKAYQKLLKTLDPASRELLRASQRQWLAFRDAEKKFQAGPWSRTQGTSAGVIIELANVDILRSRVLTLRNYAGGGNPN